MQGKLRVFIPPFWATLAHSRPNLGDFGGPCGAESPCISAQARATLRASARNGSCCCFLLLLSPRPRPPPSARHAAQAQLCPRQKQLLQARHGHRGRGQTRAGGRREAVLLEGEELQREVRPEAAGGDVLRAQVSTQASLEMTAFLERFPKVTPRRSHRPPQLPEPRRKSCARSSKSCPGAETRPKGRPRLAELAEVGGESGHNLANQRPKLSEMGHVFGQDMVKCGPHQFNFGPTQPKCGRCRPMLVESGPNLANHRRKSRRKSCERHRLWRG